MVDGRGRGRGGGRGQSLPDGMEEVHRFPGHQRKCKCLAIDGENIFAGFEDAVVKMFSLTVRGRGQGRAAAALCSSAARPRATSAILLALARAGGLGSVRVKRTSFVGIADRRR